MTIVAMKFTCSMLVFIQQKLKFVDVVDKEQKTY